MQENQKAHRRLYRNRVTAMMNRINPAIAKLKAQSSGSKALPISLVAVPMLAVICCTSVVWFRLTSETAE
jgi:hypothetical protein